MPFITTENKLRYLVVIAPKKLDIGVAGLEILSGSRDLLSLPERMLLVVATQLTQEESKHKDGGVIDPCVTSKLCLHSNLRILQLLALRLL